MEEEVVVIYKRDGSTVSYVPDKKRPLVGKWIVEYYPKQKYLYMERIELNEDFV